MRWLLALWLAIAPACAQEAIIGSGVRGGTKASVAGYTGPGDIVSGAVAFYSCTRAYNAAYATGTNKSCNLRNTSTSETCDLLIGSNGTYSTVTSCSGASSGQTFAAFCGGNCAVPKAYDQSGGGNDVSQGTAANQPTMGANCNSIQCMTYSAGAPDLLQSGAISTTNQPFTMSSVAERVSNNSAYNKITSGGNAGGAQHFTPTNNQVETYCGNTGVDQTASDGTLHSIIGVCNSTNSFAVVDGSAGSTGDAGSLTWNQHVTLGAADNSSQPLGGYIAESGTWPSGFNATQYGNMRTNQKNYWSLP